MNVGKVIQKQTLTFLSNRYSVLLIFAGVVLIIVSAFQFGETTMEWSRDQYSQLFNIYHDNIAGKAFQNRMCLPMPIDAVYTWVNGSDPQLIEDLMNYKHTFETSEDGNKSSSDMCKLEHCLPFNHLVIDGLLPKNLTFTSLKEKYPFLRASLNLFNLSVKTSTEVGVEVPSNEQKVTLIEFKTIEEVNKVVDDHPVIEIGGKNLSLSRGFLTTDGTHQKLLKMNNIVMATGLEKDSTEENVKSQVPEAQREFISKVDLRIPSSAAVLTISKDGDVDNIVTEAEKASVESTIKLVPAYLVWNLEMEFDGDMSPNRFEDNEALRYSLRSLEKHAPWIRHVYIVTNGQIPSWINLDNSRLTLISHSQIFLNQSHLPTFSSPAIESHIHRIPGLSEKFIYLNDDTMFGKDVWPDDFYTHAGGQKVYLTWPVPNCAEGCPSSWIKDNYCDKACNTSECDWDGGDCQGVDAPGPVGGPGIGGGGESNLDSLYCSSGCANSWVADKYCDTSCNNIDCGYDAGDCGTANFGKLFSEKITGPTNITMPKGLQVAFFNVTPVFGKTGSIEAGHYQPNDVVRTATIAQLFKTVHLLLHKNFTETEVVIKITGKNEDGNPAEVTIRVTVDTRPVKETAVGLPNKDILGSNETHDGPTETPYIFQAVPAQERNAKVDREKVESEEKIPEVAEELLNDAIKNELAELDKLVQDGDLTEKGYNLQKARLLSEYLQSAKFDEQRKLVGLRRETDGDVEEEKEGLSEKKKSEQRELTDQQKEMLAQRRAKKHQLLDEQIKEGKDRTQFLKVDGEVADQKLEKKDALLQGIPDQGIINQNDVRQGKVGGIDDGVVHFNQNQLLDGENGKDIQQQVLQQHNGLPQQQQQLVGQQFVPGDARVQQGQQGIQQQFVGQQFDGVPVQQQQGQQVMFKQQGQQLGGQQVNGVPAQQQGMFNQQQQQLGGQQLNGVPAQQQALPGMFNQQQQLGGQQLNGVPVQQQGQQGMFNQQQQQLGGQQLNGVPVQQQGQQGMFNQHQQQLGGQQLNGVPVQQQGQQGMFNQHQQQLGGQQLNGVPVQKQGQQGMFNQQQQQLGGQQLNGVPVQQQEQQGMFNQQQQQLGGQQLNGLPAQQQGQQGMFNQQQQQLGGQQLNGVPAQQQNVVAGADPQQGGIQQQFEIPKVPEFDFKKIHQDIQDNLRNKKLQDEKAEDVKSVDGKADDVPKGKEDQEENMENIGKRRRLLSEEFMKDSTSSKSITKRSVSPSNKWNSPNVRRDPQLQMRISDGKGITKEEKLSLLRGDNYQRESYKIEPLNSEMVKTNEKYSRQNSFLPWERSNLFANRSDAKEETVIDDYENLRHRSRKLLDTYGNSLRYVNKLYNKRFGFVARKVPAHMVHMVDVNIMNELQNEFPTEFDLTSSHRIRHSQDMQFSFSYMYYMMSTPMEVNASEVFDEFDTDRSGILSDREIRTLATRLYDLPLDLQTLTGLEQMIINCSRHFKDETVIADTETIEEYYVKEMPQVTKSLILNCGPVIKKMEASVEGQTKYKHEIMGEEEIAFKMIRTNVSHVIGQLDDVRKNPKKFVCLNDNINHNAEGSKVVKAVLQDYYEAMFPIPSQFELPREYRNRFLHIDELAEWRVYRDWLRFWTHISLAALVLFSIATFCSNQLVSCKRRCCGRRRQRVCGEISEMVFHV